MTSPIINLNKSMKDVKRLIEIHADVGGTEKGRRYGLDVLNKSGVLFVSAAWEAFVEDVAIQAIDHILKSAKDCRSIPLPIRRAAAKDLEEDKNDLKVWDLAGNGWKTVVRKYRDQLIREQIATFNTPKPHNVDNLFKKLIGIEKVSITWYWQGMSKTKAYSKLKEFIETRGAIAHRGNLPQSITKSYVEGHRKFIYRLAVKTSNIIRSEVKKHVGSFPWKKAKYKGFN